MPTQNFVVGEMVNRRTRNTKTWMNFDGSYTTEIYSNDIHFEDESGMLQNINTDLIDESEFDEIEIPVSKHNKKQFIEAREKVKIAKKKRSLNHDLFDYQGLFVPYECRIPRNFMKGYSIGNGQNKLTFIPKDASPAKGYVDENSKNKIIYQDAWNDTDIWLEVNATGIKETLYLKTDRAPLSFSFEVYGDLSDDFKSGDLKLAPAWLIDATGTARDVPQTIRREDDKTYIDLTVDVSDLVYPIEVDPTVTLDYTKAQDTYIERSEPDRNSQNNSHVYVRNDTDLVKGLLKFDLTSIPISDVLSASLSLYGQVSDTNVGRSVQIQIKESPKVWDVTTVTWNNFGTSEGSLIDAKTVPAPSILESYFFDVKSVLHAWVNGQKANNGFLITVDYSTSPSHFFLMYLSEDANIERRPKLSVTYNVVPTKPIVTSPNGGENWNALHTISWNQSTDAENDPISYEIQLTTNNGSTWKTIKTGVTGGSTTYDFINEPETSTAKIRIRAYDGTSYSPYDESNGVFTIQHNHAPTVPTDLSPSGGLSLNRAEPIRFQWTHNDSDFNGDPQAKFDLQWRLQGGTWSTITQTTPNQYYNAAPNTFPAGTIEWRVRTYDQAGLVSPYSNSNTFISGTKADNPTIISPTNGEVLTVPNPVIQWSSVDQTGYHLKVLDEAGTNLLYEEIVNSPNKAITLPYSLANDTSFIIRLATKNSFELYSDFVGISVTVLYTPPQQATITVTEDNERGAITLSITNPSPVNTQPAVEHQEIFRRKIGDVYFERINIEVQDNGTYTDYTPQHGATYEYYVRTVGTNTAFTDSEPVSGSVTFQSAQLALPTNYDLWVKLKHGASREKAKGIERALSQFAGRPSRMAEFGESETWDAGIEFIVLNPSDLDKLDALVEARETLLYRDNHGKREFVTTSGYSVEDGKSGTWTVSINLEKVYYVEVV